MKKIFLISVTALMSVSCGWQSMGRLNIVSTRNLDVEKRDFVLIERDVEAVLKNKQGKGLEELVDKMCKDYRGEFLSNAKLFIKDNGKKIKIVGDVWGEGVHNTTVTQRENFKVGDAVMFKRNKSDKWKKGTIEGITPTRVVISDLKGKIFEIPYEYVTNSNNVSAEE